MALIRIATRDDAAAIARVHVEGRRTTYRGIVPDAYLANLNVDERTVRWSEILTSGSLVSVAEQDREIVGFISGGAIRQPVGICDAELYAIYLDSLVRVRGIGTALLADLAKRLDQEGFVSMAVWVLDANAATRFYERSGAVSVATKDINIGGVALPATAYAWQSIRALIVTDVR